MNLITANASNILRVFFISRKTFGLTLNSEQSLFSAVFNLNYVLRFIYVFIMTNYLSQFYDVRRYTFIPHKIYNLIPGCENILHHLSFLSYIQMT